MSRGLPLFGLCRCRVCESCHFRVLLVGRLRAAQPGHGVPLHELRRVLQGEDPEVTLREMEAWGFTVVRAHSPTGMPLVMLTSTAEELDELARWGL